MLIGFTIFKVVLNQLFYYKLVLIYIYTLSHIWYFEVFIPADLIAIIDFSIVTWKIRPFCFRMMIFGCVFLVFKNP